MQSCEEHGEDVVIVYADNRCPVCEEIEELEKERDEAKDNLSDTESEVEELKDRIKELNEEIVDLEDKLIEDKQEKESKNA